MAVAATAATGGVAEAAPGSAPDRSAGKRTKELHSTVTTGQGLPWPAAAAAAAAVAAAGAFEGSARIACGQASRRIVAVYSVGLRAQVADYGCRLTWCGDAGDAGAGHLSAEADICSRGWRCETRTRMGQAAATRSHSRGHRECWQRSFLHRKGAGGKWRDENGLRLFDEAFCAESKTEARGPLT